MNTSPADEKPRGVPAEPQGLGPKLPRFLLSAAQPCEVQLISDASQQSQPSKTKAELLADGQCEV